MSLLGQIVADMVNLFDPGVDVLLASESAAEPEAEADGMQFFGEKADALLAEVR